jgi:dTMP kinase
MFITFEGLDGSGKTTQAKEAAARLRELGCNVLLTREPGGTLLGDQIRVLLQDRAHSAMTAETELLLFSASRAQLVGEVIRPFLAESGIVICDRFADSTIAYQGYGRGIDLEFLQHMVQFATGGLRPDLTLYLDIDPAEGLARRKQASLFGEEFSRIDQLELDFHQRVQRGYHELMRTQPDRWWRIDGTLPTEQVTSAILTLLTERLGLRV